MKKHGFYSATFCSIPMLPKSRTHPKFIRIVGMQRKLCGGEQSDTNVIDTTMQRIRFFHRFWKVFSILWNFYFFNFEKPFFILPFISSIFCLKKTSQHNYFTIYIKIHSYPGNIRYLYV